jgi:hypothetical protein
MCYRLFASIVLSACLATSAFASDTCQIAETATVSDKKRDAEKTRQAVGVTAGLISGVGFAFRTYSDNEENAHHFGGVAFAQQQEIFFNLGYEYLTYLAQFGKSRLAWFTGMSNFFSRDDFETWNLTNLGTGIAFEYGEKNGFNVAFELPLSVGIRYQKNRRLPDFGEQQADGFSYQMLPIPAVMLLYRF